MLLMKPPLLRQQVLRVVEKVVEVVTLAMNKVGDFILSAKLTLQFGRERGGR